MKKILVLCDAGQTRSVAMAYVLRQRGHFAVAGSYDNYTQYCAGEIKFRYTDDGIPVPFSFAQFFSNVILMQEGGDHFIGRDEYADCMDKELLAKCEDLAMRLGL
jgi:hypothetical protein